MPWRLLAGSCVAGVLGGAAFGFVWGLDYLPTLPFAVVEGGFLIGVPATVLGLILVGVWSLGSAVRRQPGPLAPSAVGFACLAGEIGGGVLAVLAAAQLRWRSTALAAAEVVVGGVMLVLSVVTVGGRIAHANSFLATSGGSTAFGAGAPLSVLAALLLLAAAIVMLVEAPPGRCAGGDGPPSG